MKQKIRFLINGKNKRNSIQSRFLLKKYTSHENKYDLKSKISEMGECDIATKK